MSHAPHRLSIGGLIDRTRPLTFSVDGRMLTGYAGDTLASALLAAGRLLVGRSFKYHRPRGFVAAGVEEPNGLFTIGAGAARIPNVAGTTIELETGLRVERQNGWPSVDFDLNAVNSLAAPLLGAGFYYKTFMGPRRGSWMFYEKYIRRAAGLGRADHAPDSARYETRHAFADVAIVGAGPAGLAAASAAASTGARVVLIEQDWQLGGSLLSEAAAATQPWIMQCEQALAGSANVEILRRTTALGLYDGSTLALCERAAPGAPVGTMARETIITLRAKAIVFATGALERPLVFGNNDLPGVMLAGALRTYLNRYAVMPGGPVLLGSCADSAYATALDLASQGVAVTIAEQRATVDPHLAQAMAAAGVRVITEARILYASGARRLRAATVAHPAQPGGEALPCAAIGMAGGWAPVVHLTSHTGVRPVYAPALDAFVPGPLAPGHLACGAAAGTYALGAVVETGHRAGSAAAAFAGIGTAAAAPLGPPVADWPVGIAAAEVPRASPRGKAFLDLQNDASTGDLRIAHDEGFASVEHLKRYTTLGMGTDQGKTSNINAIRLMAALRGVEIEAAGTTTFRPPYTPVSVGALAGRSVGLHFRPVRRSPLHDWHVANGGVFTEAGLWLRALYYRWAGETVETAYVQEMRCVRSAVGLSDVSTLGKIDVQGPDAAEFLNRVYVNGFAKLTVGKARYGVMLNDDATVLDDGTTARFDESRYFMTTTTAQAAEVMSRLEFLLQTAWQDLRVNVTSLTDQWAGMCIAGPRAREALSLALPGEDLSNAALVHMGCRETLWDGVPLKLLRLSFSGELAYELYVPANSGIALWSHLLSAARSTGIRPYGLEALASLRIEKGHVAGLELDRRNTLDDLGLGRMASADKAYIGRELRQRPELQHAKRWSLVGLECLDPAARLRGGAILFANGEPQRGHGRGYITSVTWSVELNKFIALALYQGGLAHLGEEIACAFPLKGETVRARIVSPVFIDPAGARLHG